MPRPPRIEAPDALYHVTGRGVMKSAIVRDDHDRIRWTEYLKEAVIRFGLELYAYVLMDNHFHLFLSTPLANLGKAMQYLNGAHGMYFNTRYERSGHLFERRYRAILIETQGHYTEISRYIHLNPVRAGMVKRPEQYAWSSYYGYHSARSPFSWLNYERVLAEFATTKQSFRNKGVRPLCFGKETRDRYRKFVEEGIGGKLSPPWARAIGGWILGSPAFAAKTYALLAKDAQGDRWNSRAALNESPLDASPAALAAAVCRRFNITLDELRERDFKYRSARRAFVYLARMRAGLSLKSTAAYMGAQSLSAICELAQAAANETKHNAEFRRIVGSLEREL